MRRQKYFHIVGWLLMSIGYLWLWYFNRNPHVLLKFITMEAYFLTWVYFFLLVLERKEVLGYSMERLFELNFTLQMLVTPAYWALIHGPMVASGKFPHYQVNWNIYIHVVPIVLLILEFSIMKRQFHNNWQDTLKLYYLFCLPVNLLYSHLQKPVYQFLLYDDLQDYLAIFLLGLLIVLIQTVTYHFLKGWNRRNIQNANKRASKTQ